SAASPIPISLSTTGSRTMTQPVKSSRTGTLPCVRVISGASRLVAPAVVEAEGGRLEARLPLPGLVQGPARLPREGGGGAVEGLLLHRSFSAATVGRLTSVGILRYAPVPRSRRKPNSRP